MWAERKKMVSWYVILKNLEKLLSNELYFKIEEKVLGRSSICIYGVVLV